VGDKLYIADTNNHMIRIFDPSKGELSTLKLTGLEKLAKKSISGFTGKELAGRHADGVAGCDDAGDHVQLPDGTKFNKEAPFRIQATSRSRMR
jgi:hypothetical protein